MTQGTYKAVIVHPVVVVGRGLACSSQRMQVVVMASGLREIEREERMKGQVALLGRLFVGGGWLEV